MHGNLVNDRKFGWRKLLKLKFRRGDLIIQIPLFNLKQYGGSYKSTPQSWGIHSNGNNDKKFGSIKLLKFKYRRGDQIIKTFCKIRSAQEIWSRLFNLQKFEESEKSTQESWRMHWNLVDDDKFGSIKVLKLRHRCGNQIIKAFCKVVSPQKLDRPSLICRNFKTLGKVLLNHAECIEI